MFYLNEYNRTCKSDSGLRAFSTNYRPPRGSDKIRALSGPSILPRQEDMLNNETEVSLIRDRWIYHYYMFMNDSVFISIASAGRDI